MKDRYDTETIDMFEEEEILLSTEEFNIKVLLAKVIEENLVAFKLLSD